MKKTLLTMLFGILFFSCAEKMPDNTKGSTVSDPYVIGTPADFAYVRSKIAAGATVYIELSADIDMESVKDYVPFNNDEPYDKTIHFDGKGYTISNFTCSAGKYPSLFGVLQGSCKNLNMDNVNISGAGECGALAAYVGTENRTGVVENVSVKNANIINSNENKWIDVFI